MKKQNKTEKELPYNTLLQNLEYCKGVGQGKQETIKEVLEIIKNTSCYTPKSVIIGDDDKRMLGQEEIIEKIQALNQEEKK